MALKLFEGRKQPLRMADQLFRLEPVSLAVLYAGLSPRMGMEGKNDMCMIVIVPKETGRTLP